MKLIKTEEDDVFEVDLSPCDTEGFYEQQIAQIVPLQRLFCFDQITSEFDNSCLNPLGQLTYKKAVIRKIFDYFLPDITIVSVTLEAKLRNDRIYNFDLDVVTDCAHFKASAIDMYSMPEFLNILQEYYQQDPAFFFVMLSVGSGSESSILSYVSKPEFDQLLALGEDVIYFHYEHKLIKTPKGGYRVIYDDESLRQQELIDVKIVPLA